MPPTISSRSDVPNAKSGFKKIFLTGATGFVGKRIFKVLKEKGYSVRCLLRPNSDELKVEGSEIVRGNVWERNSLTGLMDGCDAVIHLVGIIQERKLHGNTFEKVHFEGTKNLVDEAIKSKVKKFVQMSSLGSRENAQSQYHKTKWKAEEYIRNSGISFTIFRPSVIFGELPCEFMATLFGLASFPVITPIIGSGDGKLQPVYAGDVARCFEQSLRDEQTNGKTYELGGTKPYTFVELMTTIETILGKRKFKFHLPMWYMQIVAFLMDCAPFPTPLSRDQLKMLMEDNICDPAVIQNNFKFQPTDFKSWLINL